MDVRTSTFTTRGDLSGVPVSGIVVEKDTDAPIAKAGVSASAREEGREHRGGADGRFHFELDPGEYRVSAGAPEQGYGQAKDRDR